MTSTANLSDRQNEPQQDHLPSSSTTTIRESELQHLLQEERLRNDQIKSIYLTLKTEHLKLQKDFISLQSDMKEVLQEVNVMKDRHKIEVDRLNGQLSVMKDELTSRDPEKVKERIREELSQPYVRQVARLEGEKADLDKRIDRLDHQVRMEKEKNDHLEKELVDSLDRLRNSLESEVNLVKKEREELKVKIIELSQSPESARILSIQEENVRLSRKIKSLKETINESEATIRKVQSRLESILSEQEMRENEYESEVANYKTIIQSLKEEKEDSQLKLRECIRRSEYNEHQVKELTEEMERIRKSHEHQVSEEKRLRIESDHQIKLLESTLDRVKQESKSQLDQEKKIRDEHIRQKERFQEEYHRLKELLDQERKELLDFKTLSERNLMKLRKFIEEERRETQETISKLKSINSRLDREKSHFKQEAEVAKLKHKESSKLLEEIKSRMSCLEMTIVKSPTKKSTQPKSGHHHHLQHHRPPSWQDNEKDGHHHHHHHDHHQELLDVTSSQRKVKKKA